MKERVSEMISEKESYEEIVTDGIYNETTIADQIHTICGSSVWRRKAHQRELLHWQNFSRQEEEDLADPGRYQRVRRL